MTTDELRAAAERVVRAGEKGLVEVYGAIGPHIHFEHDDDCEAVAEAYIAEHPADESDPLTPEKLTMMGGRVRDDGKWHFGGESEAAVVLYFYDNRECGDVYRLKTGGHLPLVELTTVGELRRLLSVFGVPIPG